MHRINLYQTHVHKFTMDDWHIYSLHVPRVHRIYKDPGLFFLQKCTNAEQN